VDWGLVETDRLQRMRCPSCRRSLGGGLMRQLEWSARRCVVMVVCPSCRRDCLVVLEVRAPRAEAPAVIDVDDVRHAHELLAERDWRVSELFAA
jgi:uncharacterized protein YbaR (Trm112 family)